MEDVVEAREGADLEATLLPTGTVTFLLTDIESSTPLWERFPAAMQAAIARHDAIFEELLGRFDGRQVKERGEGDSVFAVFAWPRAAVAAACAVQQALLSEDWPADAPLRVRMGLHSGEAGLRDGGYYGSTVNRTARIRGLGHGGQVLLSQATADMVRDGLPEGLGLRNLGSHLLKGLERPETIYQLLHPALPASFPPLLSPQAPRTNLPVALTSFIGREREQAEVSTLLESSRLLTLTGEGGAGKTRLALQVAGAIREAYADGVWLVELAPLTEPILAPRAVAAVLGIREDPGRPLARTLVYYLRDKELLLVLDNCEHIVEACAELASELLRECAKLTILATSREGLGVDGERRWRVPMLGLPEAGRVAPLEQLGSYAAVRLLVERVRAGQPGFTLTAQNAGAVEQVCRRLDGLPLAIELAAARVGVLTVEAIAARLDDRFRLLTAGSRGSLPHRQTLRSAMDWSYNLLPAAEQMLLCRLSVFAGGWTLDGAEAIAAGEGVEESEMLDQRGALVAKSLVRTTEQDGEIRYGLLETVREYARELLRVQDAGGLTRARHAHWYGKLAETAAHHPRGGDQKAWLERLEVEHENLRAALTWALETGAAEQGLRLAAALVFFWSIRGHLSEGRRWLARFLALGDDATPPLVRAAATRGAGILATYQGDHAQAAVLLAESLALCKEQGDTPGLIATLQRLADLAYREGDYGRTETLFAECLALGRQEHDRQAVAYALNGLGNLHNERGEYARAAARYEESLGILRAIGDERAVGIVLNNLGNIAYAQGDFARAAALHEENVAVRRALGDRLAMATALGNLGKARKARGDPARALAHFQEALAAARAIAARQTIAWTLIYLTELCLDQGDLDAATTHAAESLALFGAVGDKAGILAALGCRASVIIALTGQTRGTNQEAVIRAVRLLAAVEARRAALGIAVKPPDRAGPERSLAAARELLDEQTFTMAWAEGQAMTIEDALAHADKGGAW